MNQPKMATCLAWIKCLQEQKSPVDSLIKNGIGEIIVYGTSDLGELFVNEALKKEVKVVAITDQKAKQGTYNYRGIPVIGRKQLGTSEFCDKCVVVTSMISFEEIKEQLAQENVRNVISLFALLMDVDK